MMKFTNEPNDNIKPLPEDNDPPFSPPSPPIDDNDDGLPDKIDDTHPQTDTNIQPEEVYEEGLAGAAEASEPNAADAVIKFNPRKKTHKASRHKGINARPGE